MDLIERLHAAVKESGLSKKQVADLANMSPSRLSRLVNGRLKRPSLPAIEAVLTAIGKHMEDLYAGQPSNDVRQALRTLTEYVDRHESGRQTPAATVMETPRVRPKRRRSRTVVTYSSAANPNVILFDSGEPIRKKVPRELWDRGARRGARAVGDSMIDAGIRDGDFVFFTPETSRRAVRGKIVVIRVNTAVYLKYYQEVDGQKMLLSAKAGLGPIIVKPGDDVELYGIVVLPRGRPAIPSQTP